MESYETMGKSVRDMQLLYEIMTNQKFSPNDTTDLTINILPTEVPYPLNKATQRLLDPVAQFLKDTHTIQRSLPPYFAESSDLWQAIMPIDGGGPIEELA